VDVRRRRACIAAPAAVVAALALPLTASAGVTVRSAHGLYRLAISPRPADSSVGVLQTWQLRLLAAPSGRAIVGAKISVRGDMPAHGHGLPTQPRVRGIGNGRYLLEGLEFQMGGRWYVEFRIRVGKAFDTARVSFDLTG
jgi:YtkA-like